MAPIKGQLQGRCTTEYSLDHWGEGQAAVAHRWGGADQCQAPLWGTKRTCQCRYQQGKLWAEVEDDGGGFDAASYSEQALSPLGGLGIRG